MNISLHSEVKKKIKIVLSFIKHRCKIYCSLCIVAFIIKNVIDILHVKFDFILNLLIDKD